MNRIPSWRVACTKRLMAPASLSVFWMLRNPPKTTASRFSLA